MTPTLFGRLQTRLFIVLVIGGVWTAIITPAVPMNIPLGPRYKATYGVLVIIAVVGLGWELLYHLLQQWRWEKDWPTMFGLLLGVPEGVVAYLVSRSGVLSWTKGIGGPAFLVAFGTTWIVTWLFVNGPMRTLSVHWRYRGGRLV
ncbi:MAG: hypothetical protein ACYDB7_07715 [Mycobacteriales bacterium]